MPGGKYLFFDKISQHVKISASLPLCEYISTNVFLFNKMAEMSVCRGEQLAQSLGKELSLLNRSSALHWANHKLEMVIVGNCDRNH